ncbi:unnamed protein product [Rotaria sp. Silwood2]|nr:unnamed protein product [Rotaria sp. Silwood2]CAF3237500.1 unnamed protein product [Rotaria sp. Silwood2]CAF3396904.1 unnamed protein product [Rotaria sp. Silwood2]CAF3465376.1 unnamed protein product [Rotaria sp. Silwood2]CAF4419483.1 unnamed protein product [Rotaria sp. Silwood2]
MQYIRRFIQNNLALKEIYLYSCHIDDDGAVHLTEGLPESNLERTLEMSQNSIFGKYCDRDNNASWQQASQASKQNKVRELI